MHPELKQSKLVGIISVVAAAVVNEKFRSLLLSDASAALNGGYLGQPFALSQRESDILLSIHADTLADLANQILNMSYSDESAI